MKFILSHIKVKIRLFPALAIMPLFFLFCYQVPVSVNQPLDAPTGVTAIAVSESSINVSWNDIAQDVEGFIVERSATGGTTFADWTAVNDADTNTYNDTNLSPQTNYYYRVMAYSGNIKSNYSAIVNATTQAIGTPAAPSGFTASVLSSSSIRLTWIDNSNNETGFILEYSIDNLSWSELTRARVTTYVNDGLTASTTYYYRVWAYNSAGESTIVTESATTQPVVPAAPLNLTASVLSSSSIRLTWTDNSNNETGFRIERAPDSGGNPGTWGEIDTTTANVTSYINSGCETSTKYHYRVRAYNGAGNSGYTDIVFATTSTATVGSTIADYLVAKDSVLRAIPDEYINTARTTFRIAYFHTSHGTHVSYGIFGLPGFKSGDNIKFGITNNTTRDPNKLDFHDYGAFGLPTEGYDDLSQADNGSWSSWLGQVRRYLDDDANDYINVMMWSWCDITNHRVSNYLTSMQTLIDEYGVGGSKIGTGSGKTKTVSVTFIFMTGHAVQNANTGTGRPKDQSQLIVNYCNSHRYYCLDYYSIDTHTMDDLYYEDTNDDGVSATGGSFYLNWQNEHLKGTSWYDNRTSPGGTVSVGEHNNQHITSNRKAFAFWWILARLAGWDGN